MNQFTALVSPWRVRMLALIYRTAMALPLLMPACTVVGGAA